MTEPTVAQALRQARAQLPLSTTPQLDAELLLAHVMQRPRSFFHARPETLLDGRVWEAYQVLLQRRASGEPLAYITAQQDFWTLTLDVSPAVLVPRPDTELLVEIALGLGPQDQTAWQVADLGTGSGAIALALGSERPHWCIHATDISSDALAVAQGNAMRLAPGRVNFFQGAWYEALPSALRLDCIISNPPYLEAGDRHIDADGLSHEPRQALVAAEQGLADLYAIIDGAPASLRQGGWLLLEHGHTQGAVVRKRLQAAGLTQVCSHRDLAGHERVSQGQYPGGTR